MRLRILIIALCLFSGAAFGLGDTRPPAPAPEAPAAEPAPEAPAPAPAAEPENGGDHCVLRAPAHFPPKMREIGERLYHERVVCGACLYADLEQTGLSAAAAKKVIWRDLRKRGAIGKEMSLKQRFSVKMYIRNRFGC